MQLAVLVRMANEIAGFFRAYPDDEACAGIRGHMQSFWTPVMRAQMLAGAEVSGLDPLVAEALRGWTGADNPVGKATNSPIESGAAASDAG